MQSLQRAVAQPVDVVSGKADCVWGRKDCPRLWLENGDTIYSLATVPGHVEMKLVHSVKSIACSDMTSLS